MGLPFQNFRLSREFSIGTHQENVYHLHPNRNFREFVVNGKQPLKLAATRGRPELPRSLKPRVDPNFLETPRGTDRNSLVNLRGTDTNFATLLNSPCQQFNRPFPSSMRKKKKLFSYQWLGTSLRFETEAWVTRK